MAGQRQRQKVKEYQVLSREADQRPKRERAEVKVVDAGKEQGRAGWGG